MKYCIDCSEEMLINPVEGNTDRCATHNYILRRAEKDAKKKVEKYKKAISKKMEPRAKPRKVSEKRKVLNAEYSILREAFLKEHTECDLKLLGCQGKSTQVHHTASGWNKATNLNNVSTWLASCDMCNQFLHDKLSANEARDKGLKI